MIRLVAFDLDGVLIPSNASYKYFEQHHGITRADFGEFFRGYYQDAMLGRVDLYDILQPALTAWKWKSSIEEFATVWFGSCQDCEPEGLQVLRTLRAQDVLCYVASNQDNRRADFLETQPWLQEFFHRRFFSCRMGVMKPDQAYFQTIQQAAGVAPEEILFVDDKAENVAGARACSWNAEVCLGSLELQRIVARYFE